MECGGGAGSCAAAGARAADRSSPCSGAARPPPTPPPSPPPRPLIVRRRPGSKIFHWSRRAAIPVRPLCRARKSGEAPSSIHAAGDECAPGWCSGGGRRPRPKEGGGGLGGVAARDHQLLPLDPIALDGAVPGACTRLRSLCSGVRGEQRRPPAHRCAPYGTPGRKRSSGRRSAVLGIGSCGGRSTRLFGCWWNTGPWSTSSAVMATRRRFSATSRTADAGAPLDATTRPSAEPARPSPLAPQPHPHRPRSQLWRHRAGWIEPPLNVEAA